MEWRHAGEFELTGPSGEPVDLWRTFQSHGVTELPPAFVDPGTRSLEVTVRLPGGPRLVRIAQVRDRFAEVCIAGELGPGDAGPAVVATRHLLRMEEDLSGFYALAEQDPDLSWVTAGAGRMTRCATVFEDVIKTICTTNCSWGATCKMVDALVEHLGEPAPGAPATGTRLRVFPAPQVMADRPEAFYREVVRCGYRAPHLRAIAAGVVSGELDLESLGSAEPGDLPDEEVRSRLLALPGVGPYAAAHIMMMLGRYANPILDSWTRPKYAALVGQGQVTDDEIVSRFGPYERWAGLAFWLFVTRDWVDG